MSKLQNNTQPKGRIYGITGKARAGKDTIAEYLWAQYGVTRIAFADPLKLAAQNIFGLTQDQTWNPEFKEVIVDRWGMTPRQIFQKLGTEAIRNTFGPDVWIKRFMAQYEIFMNTDDVVVPDVRFPNEARAIRDMGGVIIEVRRTGSGLDGGEASHASESGIGIDADYVIYNDGTLQELYSAVEKIVGAQ